MDGTLDRHACRVLINCGASSNFLSTKFAVKHGLLSGQKAGQVTMADGRDSARPSWLSHRCRLKLGQYVGRFRFTVTELGNGYDVILGMPWLEALQPAITWDTKRLILQWDGRELVLEGRRLKGTGKQQATAPKVHIQQVSEKCIARDASRPDSELLLFIIRERVNQVQEPPVDEELEALKEEFRDVLVSDLPPGLPPARSIDHRS